MKRKRVDDLYIEKFYQKVNFFEIVQNTFHRGTKKKQTFVFETPPIRDGRKRKWSEQYSMHLLQSEAKTRFQNQEYTPITKKRKRSRTCNEKKNNTTLALFEDLRIMASLDFNLTLPFNYSFPLWLFNQYYLLNANLIVSNVITKQPVFQLLNVNIPLSLINVLYLDTSYCNPFLIRDIECDYMRSFSFPPLKSGFASAAVFRVTLNYNHARLAFEKKPQYRITLSQGNKQLCFEKEYDKVILFAELFVEPFIRKDSSMCRYIWRIQACSKFIEEENMPVAGHENGKFSPRNLYSYSSTIWDELKVLEDFVQSFYPYTNTTTTKKKKTLRELLNTIPLLEKELGYLILEFYWPHTQRFFQDSFRDCGKSLKCMNT